MFTRLAIYQDSNNNGLFDPGPDVELAAADTLLLDAAGQLLIPLPGFIKNRSQGKIMHTALGELKAFAERSAGS